MQELLAPPTTSKEDAFARCERHLNQRSRAWRLLRRAVEADRRGELATTLAWHRILRAASPPRRAELARELERAYGGAPETPLGQALSATVQRFSLPPNLFRGPFLALEEEERRHSFITRGELLGHVRRLALPEGRLLLRVLGVENERRDVLADALCSGLQLTHWMAGLRSELARGRLRIPGEDLARFGLPPQALEESPNDERVRRLVAAEVAWARELLARGWPLCQELGRRRGSALAFVLRWHAASLSALEARDFVLPEAAPRGGWLRALACGSAALLGTTPRLV